MRFAARGLDDCWGIDVSQKLTAQDYRNLAATPLPNGAPIEFVWRYVALPGNNPAHDIDLAEAEACCSTIVPATGNTLVLLLVQHCRSGSWEATVARGQADGEYAGEQAQGIGYPSSAHLALDDESVANPGVAVRGHCIAWCGSVLAVCRPCIYEGFDPGLTPDEEYALPNVNRYWGAMGNWQVSKRGVCCRQGGTIRVAGIEVDMDHAFPDRLGGTLVGMTAAPEADAA